MSPVQHLIAACAVMALLVLVVGMRLLASRAREMKKHRIHPQATATSTQMASRLVEGPASQAADNFRNLFELPVLFYTLVALAVATRHMPDWLLVGAWGFVASRLVHSWIHCTHNRVMRRFQAYAFGFGVLMLLWGAFVFTLPAV